MKLTLILLNYPETVVLEFSAKAWFGRRFNNHRLSTRVVGTHVKRHFQAVDNCGHTLRSQQAMSG